MKKGSLRRLDARATDGVERAEPNGPPTAFRIWRAGSNVTDHGPTIFSERSAELLMLEQATRGNRYSMDINHLSLDKAAPLENQRGVGFYSLEVRDGDLWAVDCEWTDLVRSGLSKDPPEWKFFSPAYDVDEAGEVVSFLNCALTNTPATHNVTALASRAANTKKVLAMKWSDIKAALDGKDEDARAAAYAAIQAAFPPDEEEGDEKKDSADEDAPESKKDGADDAEKKDAADEPAEKDSADEDEKKDKKKSSSVAASLVAEQDASIRELRAEVARLSKKDTDGERRSLIAGRQMSPELAKTLASKPLETVREICAALPKKSPKDPAAAAKVAATRGEDQGARTSRLPPEERRALDERMGLAPRKDSIRRERNGVVFGVLTADEAQRMLAANAKKTNGGAQ